jgi:hypothetical protein
LYHVAKPRLYVKLSLCLNKRHAVKTLGLWAPARCLMLSLMPLPLCPPPTSPPGGSLPERVVRGRAAACLKCGRLPWQSTHTHTRTHFCSCMRRLKCRANGLQQLTQLMTRSEVRSYRCWHVATAKLSAFHLPSFLPSRPSFLPSLQ